MKNWFHVVSPTNVSLVKVLWTGEEFLALGSIDNISTAKEAVSVVLVSSNGINWTRNH